MNVDLSRKVVVVTGGFGILGLQVAQAAAAAGASVALVDRASAPSSALPKPLSDAMLLGGVDLTSLAAAQQAMTAVADRFGAIDALVNVAGGFRWETLEGGDLATWDLMFNMNVRTAASASKAVLPHLRARGSGKIVNVGAGAAGKAGAGMGAYAASKAGVMRLTEALAEEMKDTAITVNAVLPSIIDTPQNRADMADADFSRWVTPAALAYVILFLLSAAADPITGAGIPVAGKV